MAEDQYNQVLQPLPFPKQGMDSEHLPYYSSTSLPINNDFSPTARYNDGYNLYLQSNIQGPQQNYTVDTIPQFTNEIWDNNKLLLHGDEKGKSSTEKVMLVDPTIGDPTMKVLSPGSYCSNIDMFTSDTNYYKVDNQWYYSNNSIYNQKSIDVSQELPSCAKASQKKFDLCTKNIESSFYNKDCQYNCCFDKNSMANSSYLTENPYNISVPFESIVSSIDQQTDDASNESDIIVEESEEDQTDYSEEQEKNCRVSKCLICDATYKPLGVQFFYLTSKNPLTMSSQTAVLAKLNDIVGDFKISKAFVCCECLGLVNAFDNLQYKLNNIKNNILNKFEKTCNKNKVYYGKIKNKFKSKMINYKCKKCFKIISLKSVMLTHCKRHKNKGYLCEICGTKFKSKKIFNLHRKKHLRNNLLTSSSMLLPFKCFNCDKTFRTKSNKKEHENFCLGIFPYECKNQHCDKKFTTATKLKNHMKLKHDKKFIAICSICNIGFIKVSDYKSHKITHSTDKKFSCKVCDKSYKTLSNLNFHMKIHSEKMPFLCTICSKGFMRKEYLEAHVNNHKGIKKIKCTVCSKSFVAQKNLDSHLKYHEGTVKMKSCNICGKTMTTGYEEHLRTHNNLREFECEYCDFRFNTKGALSKHKRKKHLKSVSKCDKSTIIISADQAMEHHPNNYECQNIVHTDVT